MLRLSANSRTLPNALASRACLSTRAALPPRLPKIRSRGLVGWAGGVLVLGTASALAYSYSQPVRHTVIAGVRCARVADAAVRSAVDYKWTFTGGYTPEDLSHCHKRSAERVLKALLANGGVFIKIGQHMASLFVLPVEWTQTMRPLQDQCELTPYAELEQLFLADMGQPISELFDDFDPIPVGVASLAQVHTGIHKESGKRVAVKLQHPRLAEFVDIDVEMVDVTLGWIKYWFPEFEFSWLGNEMRVNLPKEMDFVCEAQNAERTVGEFVGIKTSLYIPEVIVAKKRVLIMEFIQGGRVDDLQYLAKHNIDRNKVSCELSRIFNQMVFVNGWFHADPHPGNLLIRPAPTTSKSPYNFEIVLLDHGLYFDLDEELRTNYARLWLSLIQTSTPQILADRRKYAQLVGNIGPDLYPVFEAAITGRAALHGTWEETDHEAFERGSSMIDMTPQSQAEMDAIRNAVMTQEGLLTSVFDVLRKIPRRVIMVLKLNDLTRGLDYALATTHSNVRIFLITAKYCCIAAWEDDKRKLSQRGLSFGRITDYIFLWWQFERTYRGMIVFETVMDFRAWLIKTKAYIRGLTTNGLEGARLAAAGVQ